MKAFQPGDSASVQALFETIAPRYDLLNDRLSLGLHRLWKRQALAWVRPHPGQCCLDLCCGTGDLALLLASRVRPGGRVIGVDSAAAPLQLAARRGQRQPWLSLEWIQADALATGLPTGLADGAVMAFGLRNLADPAAGLGELRRLLRSGGRAAVLDFNRLDPAAGRTAQVAAAFQRLYLRRVVVPAAGAMGLKQHYAYLETSLARFPSGPEQERLARQAGFSQVGHVPIAAGLMGMLQLVA